MRAERKTDGTIETYLKGLRPYLAWCDAAELEPLNRATLNLWIVELLDKGQSPSTARTRMMPVRYFSSWLHAEGEIDSDPLRDMKPPQLDETIVPVLSDDQVKALLAACTPPSIERAGIESLRHRRDEAMIRLMLETGQRIGAVLQLELPDVDLLAGQLTIRRDKGGKSRRVVFGPATAKALDRYLRVRRLHRLAETPRLWLGSRGRGLAYGGAYWALTERAKTAGIEDFHPHVLRHTQSDRWLDKGGSETGLMANNGWSSMAMVQRYAKSNREQRAATEARRLNLGDV